MNLKTLDKNHAVHVLNILSTVMAWGVTCYFFDTVVTNHAMEMFGKFMMSPVNLADKVLGTFTNFTVSGNFNLMFFVLWISYATPLTACYPLLMIRNHDEKELRDWYVSKMS